MSEKPNGNDDKKDSKRRKLSEEKRDEGRTFRRRTRSGFMDPTLMQDLSVNSDETEPMAGASGSNSFRESNGSASGSTPKKKSLKKVRFSPDTKNGHNDNDDDDIAKT